jgi:hypothetical protein
MFLTPSLLKPFKTTFANNLTLKDENPWKEAICYDINSVDYDVGIDYDDSTASTASAASASTVTNATGGKNDTTADTTADTLKNIIVSSKSDQTLEPIKSQSTLSSSPSLPRQVRHQRIALNNIQKVFDDLVGERKKKGDEIMMLESKKVT